LDLGVSGENAPAPAQLFGKIAHRILPTALAGLFVTTTPGLPIDKTNFRAPSIDCCRIVTAETNQNFRISRDADLGKNFFIPPRERRDLAPQIACGRTNTRSSQKS
jgi:hypothetical protein